jgi:hypothetical protein
MATQLMRRNRKRDACGDQAILDGDRTRLIRKKSPKHFHQAPA